MKDPFPIRNF